MEFILHFWLNVFVHCSVDYFSRKFDFLCASIKKKEVFFYSLVQSEVFMLPSGKVDKSIQGS